MSSGKRPFDRNLQGGGDRAPAQDDSDLQSPSHASANLNPASPAGLPSSALQTPTSSRRGRGDRGPRQLVRWDNDLDIQLLLTIQQACNATGVKIPWQLVAETMGSKFTEGAIIQHLSKVRMRREAEDKPVPPPLRRSIPAQGSSSKKKKPMATPSKKDVSPEKTPSKPPKEPTKKRLASDSDDDPSWSQDEDRDRPRVSGKRIKMAPSKSKDHYASSDEDDYDDDLDDDKPRCAGAPFLRFGRGPSKKNNPVSDKESSDEEVETKRERMILKLPVNPERLRRLEEQGTVGTPPRKGTPNVTPTPAARHLPVRSSPIQNPDWSPQVPTQNQTPPFIMQAQAQSSPVAYPNQPYQQSFAPVGPSSANAQHVFHSYQSGQGTFSQPVPAAQAMHQAQPSIPHALHQVQHSIPQHDYAPPGTLTDMVHHGQQLPHTQALIGDDFTMDPRFASRYPTAPAPPTTVDAQLYGANTSGLPGLVRGSGLGTEYSGIGDPQSAPWDDGINWGDSVHDRMGSSEPPDFDDSKIDN